jgi:hypothetical protein
MTLRALHPGRLGLRACTILFTVGGALAACAHPVRVAAPALPPNAEPADPLDWTGAEAMNTEFYMGSRDEEAAQFLRFANEMRDIQAKQAKDHAQPIERGFHAKAHGCLWGQLVPRQARDPRTQFGIFSEPSVSRPVWVRFSNGVGWSQDDRDNDARGMAVKVMGVAGKKYAPDEDQTQDFLMTNAPTPVGKNADEFMTFAHANASGLFPSLLFLVAHPRSAAPALLRTSAIASTVTEQYWSGGAYHLGAHQAIKYTAKPCDGSASRAPRHDNPDYLRTDLIDAAKGGVCYTLYAQFQVDPDRTPIENAAKEWAEDVAPLVPMADIMLPAQAIDTPRERAFCDSLSFSPWHAVAAHKPMGHINRARRFVYGASRVYRQGAHEPKGFEGFDAPASATAAATAIAPAAGPSTATQPPPPGAPYGTGSASGAGAASGQ